MRNKSAWKLHAAVLALVAAIVCPAWLGATSRAAHGGHVAVAISAIGNVLGCPFCGTGSQTFTEEIGSMDVAVIAKIVKLPPPTSKAGDEIEKATFEITQVLKGEGLVKV